MTIATSGRLIKQSVLGMPGLVGGGTGILGFRYASPQASL